MHGDDESEIQFKSMSSIFSIEDRHEVMIDGAMVICFMCKKKPVKIIPEQAKL